MFAGKLISDRKISNISPMLEGSFSRKVLRVFFARRQVCPIQPYSRGGQLPTCHTHSGIFLQKSVRKGSCEGECLGSVTDYNPSLPSSKTPINSSSDRNPGVVYTFDFYQHLYNAVTFDLDLGFRRVKLADYLNHQPAQVPDTNAVRALHFVSMLGVRLQRKGVLLYTDA